VVLGGSAGRSPGTWELHRTWGIPQVSGDSPILGQFPRTWGIRRTCEFVGLGELPRTFGIFAGLENTPGPGEFLRRREFIRP
jgi:hypothetical protein